MKSDYQWELSRKAFVKSMLISGAALQLPWLLSCSNDREFTGSTNPLSRAQFDLLLAIQETLFPADGNGPGASDINAGTHVLWVLNDPEMDPDENRYLIEKLDKFEERCKEKTGRSYLDLNASEQHDFVRETSEIIWGRRFTSRLLTLIFEALLLDPKYNVNPDGIGWKWLNHDPGTPRPTEKITYPKILDISHEV